jgi:head-tail adaptor
MVGMNPGEYRDLIKFYKIERVSNGRGGFNAAPEIFFFETFSKIVPMKPITTVVNEQLTVYQPFTVTIRYAADRQLTPDMKAEWKGEKYMIKNIMPPDTRNRRIQFILVKA